MSDVRIVQCPSGHRWIVHEGAGAPLLCRWCGLPGAVLPVMSADDVAAEERQRRRVERQRRELAVQALGDLAAGQHEHLRDRVRSKLGGLTITIDASGLFSEEAIIDAVIALARTELEAEDGGFCSAPWHVCDEAIFEEGRDECWHCGEPYSAHRNALICGKDPEAEDGEDS